MLKAFEFVVGALAIVILAVLFFYTTIFIVGLNLFIGTQDALVFLAWCFYTGIGIALFVDFDK